MESIPNSFINNKSALVQIITWHRIGDKPLSKRIMAWLRRHIFVTQTRWTDVLTHYGNRYHFVNAPHQWETTLNCNIVSHWLGAYTKWPVRQPLAVILPVGALFIYTYLRICSMSTRSPWMTPFCLRGWLRHLGRSKSRWIFIGCKAEVNSLDRGKVILILKI